ncbi:hypothetical protein IBX65_04115 [Candidatus Aerophobetes bacterium]|nr:hypothetical protein [Candidatus Aerophobetes bacterium]
MKLKNLLLTCAALVFLTLTPQPGLTQEEKPAISLAPLLQEQLVYSFNVFDGKGWSGGFVPKSEDTIYLIANKDNALSAKKTLVYFWPITARYMAGWRTLNEDMQGTLEILKDGKLIDKLEKQDTVLSYPEGYWAEITLFYTAEEATEWHKRYKDAVDKYYEALSKFYEARAEYTRKMDEFFEQIRKRREAGEEGPLDIEIPREPEPPTGPDFYVTEPTRNYVINLPVGEYEIRLRADDGTIVEGSEKNLVVFTARRRGGVGYEIIPGNRWTAEEQCNDPADAIYAAGRNLLYFRPYQQDEYNELYHNKLLDPQNEGMKENWKWVHTQPLENVYLLFYSQDRLLERIDKRPYKVEQIPGAELGYNIVEFAPEYPGDKPTFEGQQLILSEELARKDYRIYLEDKEENTIISGSEREIRLAKKENVNFLYYLSFFPLIIGGIVFTFRRRKVKK